MINNKLCIEEDSAVEKRQNVSVDGVDTFVLTSKALSALIDCNSSLPEGRRHYWMQQEEAVSQQHK